MANEEKTKLTRCDDTCRYVEKDRSSFNIASAEPLLLRGSGTELPAVKRWSFQYLREALNEKTVPVERKRERSSSQTEVIDLRGSELFERLESKDASLYYLAECDLSRFAPNLLSDLYPLCSPTTCRERTVAFIGIDSYTPFHYHEVEHALLIQVSGKKKVQLISPSETKTLYPRPWWSLRRNFSALSSQGLAHGEAVTRKVSECELGPGDLLFIPVHWWHAVFGQGFSVSVTSFWRAPMRDWVFPVPGGRVLLGTAAERFFISVAVQASRLGFSSMIGSIAEFLRVVDDRSSVEPGLKEYLAERWGRGRGSKATISRS